MFDEDNPFSTYGGEEDPLWKMIGNKFWKKGFVYDDADFCYVNTASRYIGVYFGSWEHPCCKTFLPILKQFYAEANAGDKQIEIIYVSYDMTYKDYDLSVHDMPWVAIHYDDQRAKKLKT